MSVVEVGCSKSRRVDERVEVDRVQLKCLEVKGEVEGLNMGEDKICFYKDKTQENENNVDEV